MSEFSDEEIARLKEFAQNMEAYSRVGRNIRTGAIWIASSIAAGAVIWEQGLKHLFGKG